MPLVEKTTGGRVYLSAVGEHVTQGDRVDVPRGMVEYLVEDRGDFKRSDVQDVDYEEVDSDGEDDDSEGGGESGFDPSGFVDRTPMDPVVKEIKAGDVDDHLDAVQDAAERVGIKDAVGERRAELETEED